ncbi:MAG: ABC transporter ATP-binding protein [Myxococcota bacterium]|nr:ABC transporter ATP-binding protein [Myxococcota bacterium]
MSAGPASASATVPVLAGLPLLLEVADVTAFYGDFQALWGLGFEVRQGEIVALLGSNGAGKTTLLRVVSGLVKARTGTVRFEGRDVTNLPPDALVEMGIAHVPEGRQLFSDMTVEENLQVGSHVRRSRPARAERIEAMYSTFPILRERRRQTAGTLSGGEQQMLAISRALMSQPKLLLLDEPSLGLSPLYTEQTLAVVKSLAGPELTIVLVEQKVMEGLEIASRGYVIENGKIATTGSASDLVSDPRIREAYLGL